MIIDALKSIIDLLKLRKDAKKTDLEIDKLKREKRISASMIHRANFEDVKNI
jgi:hypothetical protein